MKLLVVGAGEMGRWVGGVVAAELDDADVAFADTDPEVAEAAADAVGGRAVPLSTDESFEAVCVAVPMSAAGEAIERHAPNAERALLDVTGRMADPVAAMGEVAPDRERVSLHPLFAASNAPGNVAVVADESGPVTERILDALATAGNRLVETTPDEHDSAMETVQAGTHAAVLSFALAAEEVPEGLTTPIFEDLSAVAEQVTGNAPAVYAEIQATFDGADRVAQAAARLADAAGDGDEFAQLYREASEERQNAADEDANASEATPTEADDS
ncbi:prephenate dehydrogenase/arogenate dehydrogenase family protein [Halorussus gelatinilyticus]|uniref:Prephenate dehydrogenase/arogenate dehydrogenase family protein n=1 Tax=Halorussus gelatinilyticus TaxID=2937524 RepID=A0A8U0IHB2_9EURY|nr:prephenate dehydrogenase/arogenate dehydrogenase family protein [Halorussus gelatinilyticus]UPW00480.1 prephenate dehydrogenase/arogenate dehydrogenase family protein [Halorussus gelatinilyticus]